MGVRRWCAPPEVAVDEDEEEHLKDVRALELGLGAVVLELGHHARDGAEEEELETHHAEAVERAVDARREEGLHQAGEVLGRVHVLHVCSGVGARNG